MAPDKHSKTSLVIDCRVCSATHWAHAPCPLCRQRQKQEAEMERLEREYLGEELPKPGKGKR